MTAMTVKELRLELGLSLDAFAKELGLSSKSYVFDIEAGGRPSVRVALAYERLSSGRIDAASLNPDVALVRDAEGPPAAA